MKLPPILTGIVLDPIAGTLDFSALGAGFDPRTVLGVLHEPSNRFIFAKGRPGLGYMSIAGSVMTLAADVSDLSAGPLTGFRDDGLLIATDARLEACRALLGTIGDRLPAALVGGRLSVDGSGVTQPVSLAGSVVTADVSGTLAAGASAAPVAANLTRQFAEITNTGGNPLSYRWGGAASAAVGHILGPGQSARYDTKVPTASLNLFSTAGTSYFVTTG